MVLPGETARGWALSSHLRKLRQAIGTKEAARKAIPVDMAGGRDILAAVIVAARAAAAGDLAAAGITGPVEARIAIAQILEIQAAATVVSVEEAARPR
jgi:hypothetical protein